LEFSDSDCSAGPGHCSTSYELQDVATGAVKADPVKVGESMYDSLNTASGVSRLCPPLRYPATQDGRDAGDFPRPAISVTSYGPFALAVFPGPHYVDEPPLLYRLYRCHSRLNFPIYSFAPGVASTHAVVWQPTSGRLGTYQAVPDPRFLNGVLLPNLQRFTARLPRSLSTMLSSDGYGAGPAALSNRTLYLLTKNDQLWAADLPSALR